MTALEILAQLDNNHKRELYKNIPDHALPKSRFTDKDTNSLTQCVLRWLTLKGHYCSRIQSQGQYRPTLKQWTKSTTKRGIGDIITIIDGKSVMIEIKVGKDRQSKYQKETQIEVQQSGGTYLIVRDFESFFQWYTDMVETPPDRVPTTGKTGENSAKNRVRVPSGLTKSGNSMQETKKTTSGGGMGGGLDPDNGLVKDQNSIAQ